MAIFYAASATAQNFTPKKYAYHLCCDAVKPAIVESSKYGVS